MEFYNDFSIVRCVGFFLFIMRRGDLKLWVVCKMSWRIHIISISYLHPPRNPLLPRFWHGTKWNPSRGIRGFSDVSDGINLGKNTQEHFSISIPVCFHSRKKFHRKIIGKNWSDFVLWLAWSTTRAKLFSEFCYTIWVNSCLLSNINHCSSDPTAALSLIVLPSQVCSLFSAQFLALMTFLALAKEDR